MDMELLGYAYFQNFPPDFAMVPQRPRDAPRIEGLSRYEARRGLHGVRYVGHNRSGDMMGMTLLCHWRIFVCSMLTVRIPRIELCTSLKHGHSQAWNVDASLTSLLGAA